MVRALIIGTGDMAYGLCRQFCIHSPVTDSRSMDPEIGKSTVTTSPAYELAVTGLHISGDKTNFLETGVPYVDLYEGLAKADVVFLAIPSTALGSFVAKNMEYIKDRILVDCTNPVKPGQNLKSALETFYKSHSYDYGVSWVKTFNDLGALELITKKAVSHSKFSTTMCGSDSYAVNKVKEFAEQALGFNVKALPDPSCFVGRGWMVPRLFVSKGHDLHKFSVQHHPFLCRGTQDLAGNSLSCSYLGETSGSFHAGQGKFSS